MHELGQPRHLVRGHVPPAPALPAARPAISRRRSSCGPARCARTRGDSWSSPSTSRCSSSASWRSGARAACSRTARRSTARRATRCRRRWTCPPTLRDSLVTLALAGASAGRGRGRPRRRRRRQPRALRRRRARGQGQQRVVRPNSADPDRPAAAPAPEGGGRHRGLHRCSGSPASIERRPTTASCSTAATSPRCWMSGADPTLGEHRARHPRAPAPARRRAGGTAVAARAGRRRARSPNSCGSRRSTASSRSSRIWPRRPRCIPERLYAACLELAGELSTFTRESRRPVAYPSIATTTWPGRSRRVVADIRRSLSMVLERNAIPIELQERAYGLRVAAIPDSDLARTARFVLAAKAQLPTRAAAGQPADARQDRAGRAHPGSRQPQPARDRAAQPAGGAAADPLPRGIPLLRAGAQAVSSGS